MLLGRADWASDAKLAAAAGRRAVEGDIEAAILAESRFAAAYGAGFNGYEKHEAPPLARRGLVSGLGLEVDQFGQESVRFNMTRRFCWRPSAVSFEAIGFASPKPCDFRRDGSTPRDDR